jgi:ribose transport system substrate-binding protein
MKKILIVFTTVLLCLNGVFAQGVQEKDANAKPKVGLVMKSLANEYFKTMEEGAKAYETEKGTFELTSVGMNSETDIDTQINAIDNFISKGMDIIVLAPADSTGLVASVKKAVDAGITVVNIDVKLDNEALAKAKLPDDFLFVGPDNADGSQLSGDALGEAIGNGANVIIIEGNPGADNATQRKVGFMRSVKKYNLNLLASNTAHWETEEANSVMTNLLVKYPNVQGVMCANDSMVIGVVKALEAARRLDVKVVGFDNITAVQELIRQGKVLATVDQYGPKQAAMGIQTGLDILGGKVLTGWQKSPVKLITKADL